NAVTHGIEPEAERVARGKPPSGCITVEVVRHEHRIAFSCRDDGRGIDAEAVRRAAVARGVVTPAAAGALGRDETLRLVLKSGVSTAPRVTELAGRGVGLDAVQTAVAQLGGEVAIASVPERGVTITLSVPVALSSLTALVVEAAGVAASLPLDAVRSTVRLAAADVVTAAEHDTIVVDGAAVPFLPLATALRRPLPALRRSEPWSAVVIEADGLRAAVGVDRLVGTSPVVLRPLPRLCGAAPAVLGASLDADGNPQIVLDPLALARAARAGRGAIADLPPRERPPVLVVDDSLTTRMLEQSILESAGYDVELATSAEEALELARRRRYSLFIVDVEMPGMNGFQFLDVVRGDAELRGTPAILVTSRNSADDKRRGTQAGARAYIVKSEFHQGRLLDTIRELVG
ncbi:MAG TPA: response regulator, partial [Polyangia bacterium]